MLVKKKPYLILGQAVKRAAYALTISLPNTVQPTPAPHPRPSINHLITKHQQVDPQHLISPDLIKKENYVKIQANVT